MGVADLNRKVLCVPDTHEPWGDPVAKAAVLSWAKKNKPSRIIHLGDLFDGYLLSRFSKNPELIDRRIIKRERQKGLEFLSRLADIAPTTLLLGNHETRLNDRLAESPYLNWWFAEHAGPPVPEGVDVRSEVRLGRILVIHGISSRSSAGSAAAALAGRLSVVQGHTHRLGLVWLDNDTFGLEAGHIAKPNAPCFNYEPRARLGIGKWTQGFAWIDNDMRPHIERAA